MNNIEDYFIHKNLPQSLDKENVQEVAKVVDDTLLSFDKTIAEVLIYRWPFRCIVIFMMIRFLWLSGGIWSKIPSPGIASRALRPRWSK